MEKKQEILKAAYDCFLKYGYTKTSMSDIGKIVHLNKASLYYYFNDKLTLYREVITMNRDTHLHELETLMNTQKSAYDKILLFLHEEISFSQKSSIIITTGNSIIETKTETKEVYLEILKDDIQQIEKMLVQGINNKEFISCDTKKVATTIMTLADALLNINCPLFLDKSNSEKAYAEIQEQLNFMIKLMLDGLKL